MAKPMMTWIGAVSGAMFNSAGDSGNVTDFFHRMFPGRSSLFYVWMDFVVTITLGPLLVYTLFEPSSKLPLRRATLGVL